MKRRARPRGWQIFAIGTVAVIVVAVALSLLGIEANVVAAAASAVAAVAALASASESSTTARDATRALGFATKPHLILQEFNPDPGPHVTLQIANHSMHPVSRASITWRMRDGTTGSKELGPLPGRALPPVDSDTRYSPKYDTIDLGEYERTAGQDQFVLEYWGAYSPIGWRLVTRWNHNASNGTLPNGHTYSSSSFAQEIISDQEAN